MKKRRILVLDCTVNGEPREGKMLQSFFKICEWHAPKSTPLYYPVKTKARLLSKLKTKTKYDVIHISAHGSPTGIGNGSNWEANIEEIAQVKTPFRKANLVHVSACGCNYEAMAEAFNSDYFLAPKTDVQWINAAVFSVILYKRYMVDGISLDNAFEYARTKTQTRTDYPKLWKR